MAVAADLRTATTFTFADSAVTQRFGGIAVDLSSGAEFGATAIGQAVIEASTAAAARTAIGAMATNLANAAGVGTALGNYANDAAAASSGVGGRRVVPQRLGPDGPRGVSERQRTHGCGRLV